MLRLSQLLALVRQFPFFGALTLFALSIAPAAQVGTVEAEQKISETAGGLGGVLDPSDYFGADVASLGDLDGDGIGDLAVGAHGHNAVWILFLNSDGTVASKQEISETAGGFGGDLDSGDSFGFSVASLGDLDGDGTTDLAAGAWADDDGGIYVGAVWILFLNADGTVASETKILGTDGDGLFGASVASLGDLDGDGTTDLAVGARGANAVWILFLNTDGTVASETVIQGPDDSFGISVASMGDLDGDGTTDLAVGAYGDDDGGDGQGAVWILFLNADGTVDSETKISATTGGLGGVLDDGDQFGVSVAALGDLDGDGTTDLAVGVERDDDGGTDQGAVWILFLNSDGTVASKQKISETAGGFGGVLAPADGFGFSVASLGDLDGDGTTDLAVGAWRHDDGGTDQGAVWILFLEGPDTTPPTLSCPPSVSVIDCKGGTPGEIVFYSVTASDDVDPAPMVVCVPPSGSFFPRGTTIVTCMATDASGNQAVCMFPVVVMPTIRRGTL